MSMDKYDPVVGKIDVAAGDGDWKANMWGEHVVASNCIAGV